MNTKQILAAIIIASTATIISFNPHEVLAAQAHPPGTLVQQGQAIWHISDNGQAREPIDSIEKFYSNRFSFQNVVQAAAADLALPQSAAISWGDGVIFNDAGVLYQVSGGAKHGFTSADAYLGQGFKFDTYTAGSLSALPTGTPIRSGSERHLPGTLVQNNTGTIALQQQINSNPFPSAAVFYSYGGDFKTVVPMNAADYVATPTFAAMPVLSYRAGAIINDNGALWAVTSTQKYGFPSAACYLNFGYVFRTALTGSTSTLSTNGTLCGETVTPVTTPGATSSYTTQTIQTSRGSFSVKLISFNLATGRVRVITDTAADADCANNCPVASLDAYVKANGAQSGINGTYFCPTDYAECANQKNSFFWKVLDTTSDIVVNKNSGLGELDPFLAFDASGTARYFKSWNEYTTSTFKAVAGMNSASLVENGQISLNAAKLDDKQLNTKSTRGAVGIADQTLYLVHVMNATIPDTAATLQALGLDYALNLDGGGSAALIYQGTYKTGPGRNLPNALLVQELP